MAKIDVSLILACYNEGPTFRDSVNKIMAQLKRLDCQWEVIFVEDKSIDSTKASVEKFAREIKNAKAIYHSRNMGRGKSITDGFKEARGEIYGFLDVDLEVSADYIPIFIAEIEKGADMAIGKRFYEGGLKSFSRVVASKAYSLLVGTVLGVPLEDTEAGYKFFRSTKILPILAKTKNSGWFWDTEVCARAYFANLKIIEVPVLFKRMLDKKSTVRLVPDSFNYLKQLIAFRTEILRGK